MRCMSSVQGQPNRVGIADAWPEASNGGADDVNEVEAEACSTGPPRRNHTRRLREPPTQGDQETRGRAIQRGVRGSYLPAMPEENRRGAR